MKAVNNPKQACRLVGLAILILASCPGAMANLTNVDIINFAFSPVDVTINANDQIKWTWLTDFHSSTSGSPGASNGIWDSGVHNTGFLFTNTFPNPGNFPYYCTVHSFTGMVMVASNTLPTPPVITSQPQSQTVLTNTTVTFSVTASNATLYQWQSNQVDIAGATSASLVISNVVPADAATYRVAVSNAFLGVFSSNAVLTVLTAPYPIITVQPQSQTVLTNTTVTFSVTASNAATYQWQSNLVNLSGATNASLVLSNAVIGDSGDYQVVVANASGSVTSSVAVLLVGYPVSISVQPSNITVSAGTPVTLVVGAAGSPAPLYQWFLNRKRFPGETNTTLFIEAATTNLAGPYSVVVSNAFGAVTSSSAVLTVEPLTSIVREKLTVTINPPGSGMVTPNLNGRNLIVANSFTVSAVPAPGQVFTNWTGTAESEDPTMTFVMPLVSNATLTANFIPSPFVNNNVAGTYSGLFWDTNNLSNENAGYFSATVAANGRLTGSLKIAGVPIPFLTTLHADGSATLELKRHSLDPLFLTVQVDLTGLETLTGTVSDLNSTFNAQLTALRAGFSASQPPANFEGYYTWAMSGGTGNTPGGYSYGTATIGPAGGVHVTLFLSDGASTLASGPLSASGRMALYASAYGGKGSVLSWLTFTNSSATVSTNSALWLKDTVGHGNYPNGFTLSNLDLWVGAYTPPASGANALGTPNVSIEFSGGDLATPIADLIALDANGVGSENAGVTLRVPNMTGLFRGMFPDSASGQAVRYRGAVLHPLPAGYGFFISGGLSGAVVIEPQ